MKPSFCILRGYKYFFKLHFDEMEMKVHEEVFCRLCLNTVNDENFTVIDESTREIFNVLLLELDLKENTVPVMCNDCHTKALDAFQFKATCTSTENCISPYVNSENGAPVDLVEIYLEERDKKHLRNVLEDEKICRLCMQTCTQGFTPVKDLESDLILKYIPEINLNSTIKPVVCSSCLDSLNTHSRFLKNCSDIRDNITNVSEEMDRPFCIKTEEIDIKSEEDDMGDSPGWDDALCGNRTSRGHQTTHETLSLHRQPTQEHSPEAYQCHACSYTTKYKKYLVKHRQVHKDRSQVPMNKHSTHSYEAKHKQQHAQHQLVHKDVSKLQKYNCNTCGFGTKYTHALTNHQQTHKTGSLRMDKHSTHSCETKHKHAQHRLEHKDVSKMPTYKCTTCRFETKRKCHLKHHELRHKNNSEVPVYHCDRCAFVTKYKTSLVNHQPVHKELQSYECGKCEFKTKYKQNLVTHELRHKKSFETPTFKCRKCNFKTKYEGYIVRHRVVHEDIVKKVLMHKCNVCDFETKHKINLKFHELQHNDISEMQL